MSEEIEETQEDTAEELMFWEGGQLMMENHWGSYSRGDQHKQEYLTMKADIEAKMAKGEPVYVQIMDERRKGSVGRLSQITFDYRPSGSQPRNYWGRNEDYLGIRDLEVVWDGRKNKCAPSPAEVEYLPNWSGGTEWQWTKGPSREKPPRVIPYDSLGQEIEAGQFVCFVHRRYGNISMKFGTVTRMTDKGSVFVKTLKLRDGERAGEELKAFEAQHLLIVNDKLMGRLMMARLSAD